MKKNKKGFTLIELLAIIVILAVIAVITVPIILNIIENAKKGAATNSALGYKDAIQKYYASKLFDDNGFKLQGEFDIDNNGTISNDLENHPIAFSGTIPSGGYATIENGKLISGCVQINEYAVRFENGAVSETKKENCTETPLIAEAFPQVTDENPGIICGNGETEDYDNSSVCYIYSVEDLVAFSSMVNSGKNFSSKTVQLMNNLDIENDKSYVNPSTNQFGDINENSTISTTLKEELTDETAKGFKPIGNNSNKFSGTFEGNTKIIKSIFINRDATDYVGLFGDNAGTVKGLKVLNANIIGHEKVGILSGQNEGNITSIIASGDILAYKTIGLITGRNESANVEAIVSGTITSTYTSAPSVGGITGSQYKGSTKGIYKSGSIITAYASGGQRTIGSYGSESAGTKCTGALSTITINGETVISTSSNNKNGYDIPINGINNIAMVDNFVDTYMAGDNNDDGYYYDYNENGEFTIYKLSEYPLDITMSGSGTQDDPYIINNYNELKQISYNLGDAGTEIYYRLNADIDLTNENPIMLASGNADDSPKRFTGVFDGNTHSINNLNLIGYNYTGLFGFNSGTIKGLKVLNTNIVGYENVGIISGQNNGSITSVIVSGNILANKVIGLITGRNESATVQGVVSGTITSTYTSAPSVGGITGSQYKGSTNGIYKSGSITTTYSSGGKRTIGSYGSESAGTNRTGALSTITINGNTVTSTSLTGKNGKDYTASELQTLAPYEEVGLNTSSTSGEYRYALDSNYNPYLIKN